MINWTLEEEGVACPVNGMMEWMCTFFCLEGIYWHWGKGEQGVMVHTDGILRGRSETQVTNTRQESDAGHASGRQ